MNMKKLMAVVLAVVIAISAMAVNVFAETYRIDLARSNTYKDGLEVTWTFDISNYSLFGYADQNSYLELRLPSNLTNTTDVAKAAPITWSIEVNGASYGLKSVAPVLEGDGKYFIQYVNFGAFTHSYYDSDPSDEGVIDNWATIPQSQMVGDISTIRLVAKMTYASNWDDSLATGEPSWENGFKDNNYDMYVQLWTAGADGQKNYGNTNDQATKDDEEVTGSYTPVAFMTVNKSSNQKTEGHSFVNSTMNDNGTVEAWNNAWVWDHSLVNRAMIMGAESAKVVIKLANPTNGVALYSMKAADQPKTSYDTGVGVAGGAYEQPWWNYGNAETEFVSSVVVDGQVSELVFDMPLEKLYNATYGIYNGGIWFTERITLQNYEPVWGQKDHYKGNPISYEHKFSEMYIELTMPETDGEEEIEVDDPIQAGDVEDEEDNIEVTDPVDEPEDTNPPTGIVLAVLPMAIAAAAVVASKRR